MSGSGRVFTIPFGVPFLSTLADAVLDGRLGALDRRDPLALAGTTILLPTRRAVRGLRQTFAERLGAAGILPRIRALGDADEEDHLLAPVAEEGGQALLLPPAIEPLQRRLVLTRLILAWGRAVRRSLLRLGPDEPLLVPASSADATRLAGDLARLIDDLAIAGKDFDLIGKIAPEEHARYFQMTLDFLQIAADQWPKYLAEQGLADPAARRNALVRAEAERLKSGVSEGPVIAAGSTGSIPATAALLKAISEIPQGFVVLPGLDQDLDDASWETIGAELRDSVGLNWNHPQFGLKQLLATLEVQKSEVTPLGVPTSALKARGQLVSEALRPAETTERWSGFVVPDLDAALAGVDLIVARNEQEEALAVAVAVRQALDWPDARVAVVTPDRTLARRIAAELTRWKVQVDDSAGAPLALLAPGVFARLVADAVLADGDPVKLLALLKHPYAAFGMDRFDCRRAARNLEIALFRGRRVPGGLAALMPALAAVRKERDEAKGHIPRARRRLRDDEWQAAEWLIGKIVAVLGPMEARFLAGPVSAAEAAGLLQEALAGAAADRSGNDELLWKAEGGAALLDILGGLIEGGRDLVFVADDLPDFLGALLGDAAIARRAGADPRVHIFGTLEARLQSADLLIMAGLDEGVWPAATRTDPWLSRAMRASIGLPPPERRIGQAAHDFAENFGAPRVIVSRAEKRNGAPTVPSRWLQRLAAVAGEDAIKTMKARGDVCVAWARELDDVPIPRPVRRPRPTPPVEARPRGLSITEIETLVRDPYAIYARHVLKLDELEPPGRVPDYALRGTLMHQAIGDFTLAWSGAYDGTAEAKLREVGEKVLAEIADFPDVHAIWWFRFRGIARWLIEWEAKRAPQIAERHAEISGALDLALPKGPFRLRGRADRIDLRKDGKIDIFDYKTGTPPSAREVLVGFAPQLALEAGMARRGAFGDGLRDREVGALKWIGLSKVEWGDPEKSAIDRGWTAETVTDRVMEEFEKLIASYDQPETGYRSRARPKFQQRYESAYDHLARFHEWALVEGEEDFLAWAAPQKT